MHAIYNARIQLLATALNNLGIGVILAGAIVPAVNATTPAAGAVHVLVWGVLGANLIGLAQALLGRLR
jgi:methylmalonyl-CoA mutase cobalamin-binding subunit